MVTKSDLTEDSVNQRAQMWILKPGFNYVGLSSKAIWGVMMDQKWPCGSNRPHDPDDFGRCYRLLELIPEWKERLIEVSQAYPNWMPMIRDWAILTAMYEVAIDNNRPTAPSLYHYMRELILEGDKHAELTMGGS